MSFRVGLTDNLRSRDIAEPLAGDISGGLLVHEASILLRKLGLGLREVDLTVDDFGGIHGLRLLSITDASEFEVRASGNGVVDA